MRVPVKLILSSLLILYFTCSYAGKPDSLLNALKTPMPDTQRALTLTRLARLYANSDFEKCAHYSREALRIYDKVGNERLLAKSYETVGSFYMAHNDYDSAMRLFDIAMLHCSENKFANIYQRLQRDIGTIYFYESNYNKCLEAYLKSLTVSEHRNSPADVARDLGNIGNVYKEQGKYEEALDYYRRSREQARRQQLPSQLIALNVNTGNVYYELARQYSRQKKNSNFYDSASYYYSTAKNLLDSNPDSSTLSMVYGNIANIHADNGDYAQAVSLYRQAIDIREQLQDYNQIALVYENLASCYIEMNELALAKKNLDKALEYATANNAFDDLSLVYKDYAELAEKNRDFEKAYHYYILYKQYSDSTFNDEGIEKRKELEMNFTFEKEREQKRLEEKASQAIREEENKRNHIYIGISIAAFAIALLIALIIYRNYSSIRKAHSIISKQKTEIEKQKEIVEEKQKEILDSIHYAKRIQSALFTSQNYFKKHAGDFFILYKPKDIVSGDFYWALHHKGKFYLATADCTGHGVPGAFMSLLNISFFNEMVVEKKLSQPNEVLNEMREAIIRTLNPEGDEQAKDGMDCVLYAIDPKNKEIEYAAANNSFYIIRKGELIICPADKMPVGVYSENAKPFTLYKSALEEGDIIYTFTDGYADQFGGPKGKKFKYKQLEELLRSVASKSMPEQKDILERTIDEWKKGYEQVDDILVIGIKI